MPPDVGVSGWTPEAVSSWLGPESILESESEECESNVKLENETNPDVVDVSNFPSESPSTGWLVGC